MNVRRKRALQWFFLTVILVCCRDTEPTAPFTRTARVGTRPNFVFLLTDDEDTTALSVMPTLAAMASQGLVFENAFVTFPLCCPSRSTILRGQYPHNHHV